MSEPLFSLTEVTKTRRQGPGYALHISRLVIQPGETIAITGPSGCGKSTALDIMGMALQPDTAREFYLRVGGQEVDVAKCWQKGQQDRLANLRLKYLGYVLQTGGLLPFLNVRQNMELTASINNLPGRDNHVRELAAALNIERLLDSMPGKLSIGERQRVAICRSLAGRPAVIMADEPTAALDPIQAEIVLDMFLNAVRTMGVTLILVTHNHDIVKSRQLKEIRITLEPQPDGVSRAILED